MSSVRQFSNWNEPNKLVRVAMIAAFVLIAGAIAIAAYIWFSGGNGQASSAISAPSFTVEPGDARSLLSIIPTESEARFAIDEVLLGEPKTVIGTTNEVAGEILLDLENPANSEVGVMRINVRTLETDNEFRNRALRGQILQADRPEYEFATFTPSELIGLPDRMALGETVIFQVAGTLNLHGVTRNVIFDVTALPISQTEIEGTASASVLYRDFGMTIPKAAGVANVSDEVRLEIEFSAQSSTQS